MRTSLPSRHELKDIFGAISINFSRLMHLSYIILPLLALELSGCAENNSKPAQPAQSMYEQYSDFPKLVAEYYAKVLKWEEYDFSDDFQAATKMIENKNLPESFGPAFIDAIGNVQLDIKKVLGRKLYPGEDSQATLILSATFVEAAIRFPVVCRFLNLASQTRDEKSRQSFVANARQLLNQRKSARELQQNREELGMIIKGCLLTSRTDECYEKSALMLQGALAVETVPIRNTFLSGYVNPRETIACAGNLNRQSVTPAIRKHLEQLFDVYLAFMQSALQGKTAEGRLKEMRKRLKLVLLEEAAFHNLPENWRKPT